MNVSFTQKLLKSENLSLAQKKAIRFRLFTVMFLSPLYRLKCRCAYETALFLSISNDLRSSAPRVKTSRTMKYILSSTLVNKFLSKLAVKLLGTSSIRFTETQTQKIHS